MKIDVDPPQNESRRDRIERNVFTQLAQMRVADRADAAVPEPRASNRRAWMFAGLGAAVAAAVILVVSTKSEAPAPAPIAEDTTPSRIVTPVGGESQFTVGDAVIVAAGDTSVDVKRAPDGGITLVVARGAVDCDVAPRNQRPPFHVIAGDISVEVVGTRFTVARTPSPRVDVVRGKVRVRATGGTWLLSAGDSWTPPVSGSGVEQVAEQVPDAPDPQIEIDRVQNSPTPIPTPTAMAPHAQYQLAQKLEATDIPRAAKMYRGVASSKDAWAAPALFGLAELEAKTNPTHALADCNEYLRRFADSAQAEDVAWLRIEILRSAGRRDEARVAATEYLRQWPQGSYAGIARRIASPP
ncbi:MAG TPA: FecR family protein [Kofleriaceae bacterium]|nr:FecR family protein [Kofleriaceae bacterium]